MWMRGFIGSLVVLALFLAAAFVTRPRVHDVPADRAAIEAAVHRVDAWPLHASVLTPGEWGWYLRDDQLAVADAHPAEWAQETAARLASTDELVAHRLRVMGFLALLGVVAFWLGMRTFAAVPHTTLRGPRLAKGVMAAGVCTVAAFVLPCLPIEGPRGIVFVLPAIAAGVVTFVLSKLARARKR